jgi:hypothetical protein
MWRAGRRWIRRLQLMTTVMALMGLVLNVFCNPFSPIQLIHWLSARQEAQVHSLRPACRDNATSPDPSSGVDGALQAAKNSDQADDRPKLDLPPDLDDTIAIRPRPRLSTPSQLDMDRCLLLAPPPDLAVPLLTVAQYRHVADSLRLSPLVYPLIC